MDSAQIVQLHALIYARYKRVCCVNIRLIKWLPAIVAALEPYRSFVYDMTVIQIGFTSSHPPSIIQYGSQVL